MIGDVLFEIAWKSTVVAAAVILLLVAMRRQAPASRVAVGGFGIALLLVLPVVVAALTLLPVPVIEMAAPAQPPEVMLPLAIDPVPAQIGIGQPGALAAEPAVSVSPGFLATFLWAAGALAVLFRLGAGLATLSRWSRRGQIVDDARASALMRRCGAPAGTMLLLSDEISAPLSWGRRIILINRATLHSSVETEAVIAHEAAHLSRGDWPRLIAARLVVALLWFNPLVWLLEQLYLQDIEEAADAEATRRIAPADYAQALLNVARSAAVPAGANSIASGALAKRIRTVLRCRPASRWDRTWRMGALASVTMVAAPIALLQFVAPTISQAAPVAPDAVLAPLAQIRASVGATVASPTPVAGVRASVASRPAASMIEVTPVAPVAPVALVTAVAAAQPVAAPRAAVEIDSEEMERIERASEAIRVQSAIIARDSQKIAERARAQAAIAMADARRDMLRGADEMDRGAIEMRRGAANMRDEARKLRNPAYRAKVIAEARQNAAKWNGDANHWKYKMPTDQELIDAIPKMEEGARNMDAGVEKMRDGARRMRESAQKQD